MVSQIEPGLGRHHEHPMDNWKDLISHAENPPSLRTNQQQATRLQHPLAKCVAKLIRSGFSQCQPFPNVHLVCKTGGNID